MPALCYILYSKSFNKFYVGATLKQLNRGLKNRTTRVMEVTVTLQQQTIGKFI